MTRKEKHIHRLQMRLQYLKVLEKNMILRNRYTRIYDIHGDCVPRG